MKRKMAIVLGALLGGLAFYVAYVSARSLGPPEPESNTSEIPDESAVLAQSSSPRAPARTVSSTPKTVTAAHGAAAANRFHLDYFDRALLAYPEVSAIYRPLLAKLPPGEPSRLLAVFIAEGPIRNSSPDFARFMTSLLDDIRSRSAELYSLLDTQDALLKQDPFVYQMALNLVFQLDLSSDAKARLYGNAMQIHFTKDGANGVTLMSANITNAFILMKNSGVSVDQARPYIMKGIAANQDDQEALSEFAARANTYFPGAI